MWHKLGEHLGKLGARIHAFTLGTTIAWLAVLLGQAGQTCAVSGQ